ncbi:MAG: cadmium-translocating P-type ATPase [Rickettsiales bacterium]|nr:cadmium-translocating P-type ATPase [Rickettsiales bacterium]
MEQTINRQHFNIEGVRCARCIHAIESALNSDPHIRLARVNMSTNRLAIAWEGSESLKEHFAHLVESLGYTIKPYETESRDRSEDRFLLRCMAVAGFAMGNIMLISVTLWSADHDVMGIATRDLLHWISALIALPTIIYAGRPFFDSAISVLRYGRTNMDVPISLALILASAMSVFETYHGGEHAYFDSAVMLLFFLLIGRWLDARARGKARENAEKLLSLMQGYATVIQESVSQTLPVKELQEGMMVMIAAGEKIPADAKIIEGESQLDTSLVTGETLPKSVKSGDTVFAGTLNLDAPITAVILKANEDTLLADIIRLMEKAEQGRAHYVRLADKAAKLYTPIVHTLAAAAFLGWLLIGNMVWQDALLIAITTLIITCPCALGLAVPVVQVLATNWLMKRGILVKSGDALERLAKVDTVVFDKTGTLTLGRPKLIGEYLEADLHIAASLAHYSKHPYSQAISVAYNGALLEVQSAKELTGQGVEGTIHDQLYFLGKSEHGLVLRQGDSERCIFKTKDCVKDDSKDVIGLWKQFHIDSYLLSGDTAENTRNVAHELDISHHKGSMLPRDKTEHIVALQSNGHQVLMVGDGLNDAPSLAQANVSMSPASGMDITQNSADIVFQGSKLMPTIQAWSMALFSTQLVKQNFALAVAYNCIAIPLAVAGFVTPLIAAIAMSSSSLIVIANSFRINLKQDEAA